ncbi:hypothetical protein Tco_1301875 [Tanacetum coccineum]
MSFVTMADEITLESLTEEQNECFIEYYHENYPKDFKNDLENLEEIYKMMNGGVGICLSYKNASPSEIKEPYEPSPRMYSYEQPSCLGSIFVGGTLRKSDQLHQTFKKSSIVMTRKLDDMIELPNTPPSPTWNYSIEMVCIGLLHPHLTLSVRGDLPFTQSNEALRLYLTRRSLEVLRKFHGRKSHLLKEKQISSVGVFDEEVILFYNGLDILTRQILDSRGAIPTKTAEDAKKAIQEMAEYSQNGIMEHQEEEVLRLLMD